jgi:hypothetical protein
METIFMKKYQPLNSHQIGIKIKNEIINLINTTENIIVLDFENVDICTDSFSQQITTILSKEITFRRFKNRVKFKNLNNFLQELIKGNLYKASQNKD